MTDFETANRDLLDAISRWHGACSAIGSGALTSAWVRIGVAITALDNAAYDRGYEQARAWQAGYRTEEIARLKQERDQAERRRTREASEADQLLKERDYRKQCAVDWHWTAIERAREIRRLKEELADACAEHKERDAARAESIKLLAALGRIEVLTRRGMNDDDLLPVVKRAQAEAWEAYRDAQGAVLPIGEDIMPEVGDEEKGNPLLRLIVSALVQRESKLGKEIERLQAELADARETIKHRAESQRILRGELRLLRATVADRSQGRLRKALETLADRYHGQVCRCRRPTRQGCSQPPLVVQDAERALAGDPEFFETDDEQLNAAERQRSTPPYAAYTDAMRREELRLRRAVDREAAGHPYGKPEPELHTTMMRSDIRCADGCGRIILAGEPAYWLPKGPNAQVPLYVSEEHARGDHRE